MYTPPQDLNTATEFIDTKAEPSTECASAVTECTSAEVDMSAPQFKSLHISPLPLDQPVDDFDFSLYGEVDDFKSQVG